MTQVNKHAGYTHPSAIVWPLPQQIEFPYIQTVRCAYCNSISTRIIHTRVQARNLWYCNQKCKLDRRAGIKAGTIEASNKLPKVTSYDDRWDSEWGDLGLNPRKQLEDISMPTALEIKYEIYKAADN